jgi:hypothetical protein
MSSTPVTLTGTAALAPYLALITAEHQNCPNYLAHVAGMIQPDVDNQNVLETIAGSAFDIDQAVGVQLDVIGRWVGVSRNLATPLTGVYFALDTAGVGLDQGYLEGPYDPTTGVVSLDDASYLILLRAKIAANHWDGTVPGAYEVWNTVFGAEGYQILIQDNQDMTITLLLWGPIPDAVTQALFSSGMLDLVPAGVRVDQYLIPSVANAPYFALDVENSLLAGLDTGAFGVAI